MSFGIPSSFGSWRLDDKMFAEPARHLSKRLVTGDLAEDIWNARYARSLGNSRRLDFVVDLRPKFRRGKAHLQSGALAQALGLLIKHQEYRFAAGAALLDEFDNFRMAQEIVVDVLNRLERFVISFGRDIYMGMRAVKAVDGANEVEVANPFIHAQQVEIRRTNEVHRLGVSMKETANV
jgi:hypothetical protein